MTGSLDFSTADQSVFNAAYWAYQAPVVRNAFGPASGAVAFSNALLNEALLLVRQGYPIDTQIMFWQWDPYATMLMRVNYGYKWVPNIAQQGIQLAPGLVFPGLIPYDPDHPPVGAITRISIFPGDFPPYYVAPNPLPVARSPIGALLTTDSQGVMFYAANMPESGTFLNGQTYIEDGKTYTYERSSLFSTALWTAHA